MCTFLDQTPTVLRKRHDLCKDSYYHWGPVLLWQYFCQLHQLRSSQALSPFLSPFKHKCQVQPQVKMPVSAPHRPAASTDVTSSLAKSIDFPGTNYPGVRDLTHKFRTAGGFSDFNHTSMLVPQSNLHCLSLAPALCQLCIDYYPAFALYCDPSLSVSIRQPPLSLSLLVAGEKQPEGA